MIWLRVVLSVHCAYLLLFRTLLSLSKSNVAVIFYLRSEQAQVFSRKSELLLFNGIKKKKKKASNVVFGIKF